MMLKLPVGGSSLILFSNCVRLITLNDNSQLGTLSEQPLYPNWDWGKVCVQPPPFPQTLLKNENILGSLLVCFVYIVLFTI